MSHYHKSDAPHWYCLIEMDVNDLDAARDYLSVQTRIEEDNGMISFEYFVDDHDNPQKVVLLECFSDERSQVAHIENIRIDEFKNLFSNFKLSVFGNPPQSAIDRMADAGFWPPVFQGKFSHMPYFMGFRKA